MLKEAWDSFKDNIKERVTNPFLGTFVLVWIVHNWKVVYAFFFFDKEYNLEKKIQFFKDYWNDKNFIWNLIIVAFIAIAILILTYLFLSLSRYLSNSYENIILPQIAKHTKGKIVLAETYQNTLAQIKNLETRLEEERKSKVEAIQEREKMEERLYKNNNLVIDGGLIGDEKSKSSNLTKESKKDYGELIKRVKQDTVLSKMDEVLIDVSKKIRFDDNTEVWGVDFLLQNGFVYLDGSDSFGRFYNFTDEGLEFKRQYFATA